jgi:hypothetical protein
MLPFVLNVLLPPTPINIKDSYGAVGALMEDTFSIAGGIHASTLVI